MPTDSEDQSPDEADVTRRQTIQRARATTGSYSITVRVHTGVDPAVIGELATAVSHSGGITTALDIVESRHDRLVIDLTCSASNGDHANVVVDAIREVPGVTVHKVSDRTFLLHIGGKISVEPTVALRTRDDLSMAYTPGVGRVSMAIAEHPEDVSRLTIKGNCVAVVTDGSAVLGLGNIGPAAAMPVMEGKAALFKRFANIDAWPICLDTQDVDEIVRTVQIISPGFGGINLEDIAAPRCFEIEAKLRALLDIPVFHDDQHGTAIVVCDRTGTITTKRTDLNSEKHAVAVELGSDQPMRSLPEALRGAHVLIGLSGPRLVTAEMIRTMARPRIVFAMANPDPEVDPVEVAADVDVMATGRSDYPNQVNNVLAFPGMFRGLLDARASTVTTNMELAAAAALAESVPAHLRSAEYILPSVFDAAVVPAMAKAVSAAARADGVARRTDRDAAPGAAGRSIAG